MSEPALAPTYALPTSDPHLELDELGDRIAVLSAQIQAATYQLLVMIREFDERSGWSEGGCLSCAHWLSWRVGLGLGAAREKVRVARTGLTFDRWTGYPGWDGGAVEW